MPRGLVCGPHSAPIVGAVLGNLWTNVLKLEPAEAPGGLVKRDAGPAPEFLVTWAWDGPVNEHF